MKKTLLTLVLFFPAFSLLFAQCFVKTPDSLYIHCGASAQLSATSESVLIDSHTTQHLNQISFYDQDHGFIVGDSGTILRTNDNGQSWALTTFLTGVNWKSVNFSSPLTGYIVSGDGKIARSTDGGVTWNIIYDDPAKCFNRVRFMSPSTGFAIGNAGLILKTTNGGSNWNTIESGTSKALNDIVFINGVKGYISGDYDFTQFKGVLLSTSDGGDTWVNSATGVAAQHNNYNFAFANSTIGYMQTDIVLLMTMDGGITWNETNTYGQDGIALWNDSTGFICHSYDFFQFSNYGAHHQFIGDNWMDEYTDVACPDNKTVLYIGDEGQIYSYRPVFESYHWEPSTGLSADNIANPVASPLENTVYKVTVQLANGSTCTDSVTVLLYPEWYDPRLCMVTVDSATSHNKIIWNKSTLATADSIIVRKEGNISGQNIRLAAFTAGQGGEYIDMQSDPIVKSDSYSILVIDKCKQEYPGFSHSTMHLSINQGVGTVWNLIWQQYYGTQVYTYNIYRGTNAGNLQLIAQVSGSVNQYTDLNAAAGDVYYLIEAILEADCSGSKSQVSSFSNLATNRTSTHGMPDDISSRFRIQSNPVDNVFIIQDEKLAEIRQVSIISMRGAMLKEWQNPVGSSFDVSTLPSGIYLLKIDLSGNRFVMRKLVKI